MGSPTAVQLHAWTDCIAAKIALDVAGYKTEYAAQTIASLYDAVDGSGDPDVEIALGAAALAVDAQSLPANAPTVLRDILNREGYRAFATAINSLVTSAAGGSHASLRAYLSAISGRLHPLAGELFRNVLGQGCFTASDVVLGCSNPTYAAIFANRVYTGADGSLADDTTDATDVGTGDVALFATDNHTLYIGSDRKFEGVVIALSTLGSATITPTFQYWNGSAWATLTVTDNSVGLTKNDLISFTAPSDWGRWYKDSGGTAFADLARLYYIRIARTADALVTPPVGTTIVIVPTYIPSSVGGTTHAAVEQPPLALIRITGTNTIVTTAPAAIDHSRFTIPVGTEGKLRVRALSPLAAAITLTLKYTDQSGAITGSTVQSAFTGAASLDVQALALTTTDGLRNVLTTCTATTTSTEGVVAVECLPLRTPAI